MKMLRRNANKAHVFNVGLGLYRRGNLASISLIQLCGTNTSRNNSSVSLDWVISELLLKRITRDTNVIYDSGLFDRAMFVNEPFCHC